MSSEMLRSIQGLSGRQRCFYRRFFSAATSKYKLINRIRTPIEAGQALFETRPNLLKPGELTPGISAKEYYQRRVNLARRMPSKSCAILAGSQIKYASGAVFYPFQQNNNMYYLSGWNEPDSVMLLEKPTDDLNDIVFHMIVPPKDSFAEQWEGTRTGIDGVKEIFNADEAADLSVLSLYIAKIIRRNDILYFDAPKDKTTVSNPGLFSSFFSYHTTANGHQTVYDVIKDAGTMKKVRNLNKVIADLRKIKSPAELRVMRRAGQISGRAYNQAYATRFKNERTLQAFLEYNFISAGCDRSAYVPVVATGSNALCIHYTRNDDVMYDDEMVLVDASGSIGGYCTDISRTWPVNGQFTNPQRDLYEAVLNVQKECMELFKASKGYSIHDIHEKSVDFMKIELRNVGFNDIQKWDVNKLYPHYIGHHLGLDVHDVPEVSKTKPIEEGQVITVEPGVYVPDDQNYPSHFHNIGIRIEDDIAVGIDSYTNLTIEAAKEIADLEHIMEHGVMQKIEKDVISPLS
ncbi:hypothetical protein HG535_0E03330 [Zygotorulaspora mrakii]|uniref:Aminopeptidase P N-terminal domain-containing protein n=1 Tax=Zygotorulaspora mrakii TaxID=42260 RepID=A0A7H9B5L1_ZYGMR|nr:uncharacterized protein HG535_0E03330 [Zygotorulaspora mrakii]QLG73249.1 hypothetical protein HG535_0E03330 [Zygotorulaspora mrakii]